MSSAQDFGSALIPGFATPEGTRNYFRELKDSLGYRELSWFRIHPKTDLALSRLGFGGYRVTSGFRPHFDALREAIISGTNVIDTSTNYSDGGSEQLVGDVIRELISANRIKREQVVVVTKVGYIQGKSLELMRDTKHGDVVEYADNCWHCIHPDFLRANIQLSRYRLGLKTIDFLLLHNPEYFLMDAKKRGVLADEARNEYERRLKRAFTALEELASRGAIRYYGISSNTLAASQTEYTSTHLDAILRAAGPHFQAVQFPGNLIETDFRYNRNAGGGILAQTAAAAGLWTLCNRPLNAGSSNGLVRLARLVEPPPDGGDSGIAEFHQMQGRLTELENRLEEVFGDRFHFGGDAPSFSQILGSHRDSFHSTDHLRVAVPGIVTVFEKTIRRLQTAAREQREKIAFEQYVKVVNAVLYHWENYTAFLHHQHMEELERALSDANPALAGQPLARQAILFLLAGRVPATVLVGMRKVKYVRQLSEVYRTLPPAENDALGILTAASHALDKF
ncbi:MAG: aldo/keto reductase [Spirochaetia bacterium]|nr:aldo/keto reductase [Spirochaetia bacterium]